MSTDYHYDFALSYAGPDEPFVNQVVNSMRARGLQVFFAPDEQADIIGRNLIDYLSEVYLNKARYCLVFISNHYAERKWTDRVERPAAQSRALEQTGRYIIPVRLDDAKIPGMLSTTAEIRRATPSQIADLAVAILLRDESPTALSDEHQIRDRLIIRVVSFTELDVDLLRSSFKPFVGWAVGNAHMIPVELRLPKFLTETVSYYSGILETEAFARMDPETKQQFTRLRLRTYHRRTVVEPASGRIMFLLS
jgi:TIR domain